MLQGLVINEAQSPLTCFYFNSKRGCPYGDRCRFAHIIYHPQLQQLPENPISILNQKFHALQTLVEKLLHKFNVESNIIRKTFDIVAAIDRNCDNLSHTVLSKTAASSKSKSKTKKSRRSGSHLSKASIKQKSKSKGKSKSKQTATSRTFSSLVAPKPLTTLQAASTGSLPSPAPNIQPVVLSDLSQQRAVQNVQQKYYDLSPIEKQVTKQPTHK